MPGIIEAFGGYIEKHAVRSPDRCRRLLLAAYRANGLSIRLFPEKRLSSARRFGVNYINDAVVRMLAHPEKSALVNVFMPCELLQAMDITPMCAEMYSSYINGTRCEGVFADAAENEGIAETFCSYHKVLVGSAYSGVLPAPSVAVNCSLVCDANSLTFRELARYYGIPHFYVDVPKSRDEESIGYVAGQLREMRVFLEEATGKRLDDARLREAVARSGRTTALLKECLREKGSHCLPSSVVSELNEIYMTHNALGTREAEIYASRLLCELKAAPESRGLKILWLYSIPIWQEPVKRLLNFNTRCQITACDMNLDCLLEMDPEKPYESMAKRLVLSGFNGGKERVRAAVENAKTLNCDGVVCFCSWGCKQSMGISSVLKNALEAEGYPVLVLNGDACDRRNASDGQVATRLEAFFEMLEKRHG
ncbi:MAG: 2-hydroxyacyl-CoA dehydratase [Oscillospiraceae bacterium]|nr:2-hydroxyacyl-CoA dehydratase [Oscillospiraceae bacterium]